MSRGKVLAVFESLEDRLLLAANYSELIGQARDLAYDPGGTVQWAGQLSAAGEKDVFGFTAAANGAMNIEMLSSALDSVLMVIDSRGRRVAMNDNASRDTADSKLRLSVRAGQTYYIVASDKNGGVGDYALRASGLARDDFGNLFETARQVSLSAGRLSLAGTINYAYDVDLIRLWRTRPARYKSIWRPPLAARSTRWSSSMTTTSRWWRRTTISVERLIRE